MEKSMTPREQIIEETNRRYPIQHPFMDIAKESFSSGAEYGYNLAIEKADEWFSEHWREFVSHDADNEVGLIGWKGEYKQAIKL